MITLGMLVWFAAAIVAHDLMLFPLYAGADRLLTLAPAVNYLRVPLLASGLTLLLFLPGIIRQGGPTHLAATGMDQQPYLARWLLLCAAFFVLSGLIYLVRRVRTKPSPPPRARHDAQAVTRDN